MLHSNIPADNSFLAAWQAFALSCLKYRMGNFENAIAWSDQCLACSHSSESRNSMIHIVLSMAHYQLNDYAAAETEFQSAEAAVKKYFPMDLAHNAGSGKRRIGYVV
ncbi:MAG: hypothetical protein JXR25_04240 [Pontiellaceae bacterium]|nr:hypothetical protein [Pontiellaceae bacterium]MBN2784013.1 hypothetical protein [Pontiellaceae bacterium]